jgi:drug/metabolite transporter (DMT)-like permease
MPTPVLVLLVTLCTIGSQLLLKRAVVEITPILRGSGTLDFLFAAATSPGVLLALAIQGAGYVVWLFVVAQERLSVAFALSGSFFYLLMAAASWALFGERLSMAQWLGLILISGGVLLVQFGNAGQP